jgi:hypothetical protein
MNNTDTHTFEIDADARWAERRYMLALEGAVMSIADTEAELGTISGHTVDMVRMVATRALNKYVRLDAVAWLDEYTSVLEEIGGEA